MGFERKDLEQQWVELAPAFIERVRQGDQVRHGLLDRLMLEACGDVAGLDVLECGCGEGRFCRMLVERGARRVLGLDLSELMVEAALSLQTDRDEYRVADVQDLRFLEANEFDLAVSYLNQCDLPDFEANTREVLRVLRKGGRFVIANLHPMLSAVGRWHRTEDGIREHVILDNYFDESERHWTILEKKLTNFHRSLSTYLTSFFQAGFVLERLIEPKPTAEQVRKFPDLDNELRVPNFIIYLLRKP